MTTAERRENILEILSEAAEPVAARIWRPGSGSAVRLSCRIWRLSGHPIPISFPPTGDMSCSRMGPGVSGNLRCAIARIRRRRSWI